MDQPNRLVDQSLITRPSFPRYPVIFRDPTFKQVTSNFRLKDYGFAFVAPTVLSAYIHYRTNLSSRAVATWALVSYPALYFLSCKNVSLRLQGVNDNESECKKHGIQFVENITPYNI